MKYSFIASFGLNQSSFLLICIFMFSHIARYAPSNKDTTKQKNKTN